MSGQAAEMLDGQPVGHPLEQPRHEGHVDAELLAALHEPEQHLVGRAGERHDHLLDAVLRDDPVEVPAGAEDRERQGLVFDDQRVLVQEADRLEPELGLRQEPGGGELADLAGADDQRRPERFAVAVRLRARPVERDAARGEIGGCEGPGADALRPQVGRVGREPAQEEEGNCCEGGRDQDRAQLLEELVAKARAVQAAEGGEAEDEDRVGGEPDRGWSGQPGRARAQRRRGCGDEEHRGVERDAGDGPRATGANPDPGDRLGTLAERTERARFGRCTGECRRSLTFGEVGHSVLIRTRARRPTPPPSRSSGPPTAANSAKSRPLNGRGPSADELGIDELGHRRELANRLSPVVPAQRRRVQRAVDLRTRVVAVEPPVVGEVAEDSL